MFVIVWKNESSGDKVGHADKRTGAIVTEGEIKRGRGIGVERKKVYKTADVDGSG